MAAASYGAACTAGLTRHLSRCHEGNAQPVSAMQVARFINAPTDREIVFTRNATEAINLVAQTWGVDNLKAGDEVCMSRGRLPLWHA